MMLRMLMLPNVVPVEKNADGVPARTEPRPSQPEGVVVNYEVSYKFHAIGDFSPPIPC